MTEDLQIDRPVKGEIQRSYRNTVTQLTASEFLAEIDAALAVPGVRGLVWEQYTPYFNDGEPCEFSVGEVRVLLEGIGDDGSYGDEDEQYSLDYGTGFSSYDLQPYGPGKDWNERRANREYITLPGGEDVEAIDEAIGKLSIGAWENVALTNFGDHAQVTATRDGFNVEYYEHD